MNLTESELRLKHDMEMQLGFPVLRPNMLDSDGLTPLMLVNLFYNNPINYTKLLIKMGADPNIINPEYGTALHSAVTPVPHYESAKYLLSVGANPFVKDGDCDTQYDLCENFIASHKYEPLSFKLDPILCPFAYGLFSCFFLNATRSGHEACRSIHSTCGP